MDRAELINKLSSLPPSAIDSLITAISGASRYDTPTLPVPTRIANLIAYTESGIGPGLQTVTDTAKSLFPTLFSIDTSTSDGTETGGMKWNVPHERNDYFVGRETELAALREALTTDNVAALAQASKSKAQAISGMGGIGKTQTAVEYAYRCRERIEDYPAHEAILFTRADSLPALLTGYTEMAKILQLPLRASDDPWLVVADVRNWLETHSNWLLIYDNADDPGLLDNLKEPYKSFRPRNASGHILLTSRARHFPPNLHIRNPIELRSLLPDDAVRFLFDRTERNPDTETEAERKAISELAQELGYFPLALEQAAVYIKNQEQAFAVYLEAYRNRKLHILNQAAPETGDYRDTVSSTWEKNFQAVEATNPTSAELLRFSAFLAPNNIPAELVRVGAKELGSPLADVFTPLQEYAELEEAYDNLLAPLLNYSLIKKDRVASTYSIHPMIQSVQRDRLKGKQAEWAARVISAICAAFPSPEYDNQKQCVRLTPHALACIHFARKAQVGTYEMGLLCNRVGNYLYDRGLYAETEPLYEKALEIHREILPDGHLDIAASLNNLATLYDIQDRYKEAEPLYVEALEIRRKALPLGHPDIATSLNNLALLYQRQGHYEEAEPLFLEAMRIYRQALPLGDPDIAQSLNNLAGLYEIQERYKEAESLLVEALEMKRKALLEGDPDTALSLNNLAELYRKQARYAEAEPLFVEALEIKREAFPEGHPSIALSLNNLAELYRKQARYKEAEPLMMEALEIDRKAWPEGHSSIAIDLNNLAGLYSNQERYGEAEPMFAEALRTLHKTLGPQHPSTQKVLQNFCNFMVQQGKKEKALAILEPLGYKLQEE